VLLDRRKVKFWQKIVFGSMAFLMAAFLVVGYSGVLNGCTFFNSAKSATDELQADITRYKNAVATDPDDAASWTKLGDNFVLMGNLPDQSADAQTSYWDQAVVAYKKADALLAEQKGAAVKRQRLEVLQSLISTYLYQSDFAGAVGAYGEVTSLTPKDAQSYFDMATVAISAGDINTALLAFTKYLELDPDSPDAAQVKAWIKQNTPKSTSTPTPSPSPSK
jgi:tetratricopeptide (TPR) repeat protein